MEDIGIDEKRVYADREGSMTAFVAADAGVVRVEIAGDVVGEFGLQRRCDARDVAAVGGRVAVATAEDVLVGTGDGLEPTGFGPADAVDYCDDDGLVAAGDGRVARRDGDGWATLAGPSGVRAVDGDLVAAADGLHRLDGTPVGLEDVADVAATGRPLAATPAGLYRLANGWVIDVEGSFRVVAADGDRAHAATADALYERDGDGWRVVDLPVTEPVAGVAHGEGTYVVTEPGTVLVRTDDGWRHRSLGLSGVTAVAVR